MNSTSSNEELDLKVLKQIIRSVVTNSPQYGALAKDLYDSLSGPKEDSLIAERSNILRSYLKSYIQNMLIDCLRSNYDSDKYSFIPLIVSELEKKYKLY